jgi:hypothetical protein
MEGETPAVKSLDPISDDTTECNQRKMLGRLQSEINDLLYFGP